MHRLIVVLALVAAVIGGCSGDDSGPTTTTAVATATGPSTTTPAATSVPTTPDDQATAPAVPQVPAELADFAVRSVALDGTPWLVAVADTRGLRSRGLMFVTDLGDLDGMLFVFETPTKGSFWMKNTLIPLDIAFFRSDGTLVAVLEMEPCGDQDPCPTYGPGAEYQYALEAPAGALVDLDQGGVLEP